MSVILGISGSLRKGSYNSSLLQAAKSLFPDVIKIGNIHGIPLYNADVEAQGMPEAVLQLKQQLAGAAGLLLVSPEYNNSLPGVLKNTIDWLSRPSLDIRNVFHGKPVAVIGASPGGFGTILAQSAWLPVFRSLGSRHYSGQRLMVSGAAGVFDKESGVQDESVHQRLEQFLRGFMDFCEI
ncbi:MAG: NAD(P)H-dependent oxidoreductase [Xanthomonadales bacterium]|nr:NAD(P)H-dependent oxidoreductase [Xanthomonadales bacterium]